MFYYNYNFEIKIKQIIKVPTSYIYIYTGLNSKSDYFTLFSFEIIVIYDEYI